MSGSGPSSGVTSDISSWPGSIRNRQTGVPGIGISTATPLAQNLSTLRRVRCRASTAAASSSVIIDVLSSPDRGFRRNCRAEDASPEHDIVLVAWPEILAHEDVPCQQVDQRFEHWRIVHSAPLRNEH